MQQLWKIYKNEQTKLVNLKVEGRNNNNGKTVATTTRKSQKSTADGCFFLFSSCNVFKNKEKLIAF